MKPSQGRGTDTHQRQQVLLQPWPASELRPWLSSLGVGEPRVLDVAHVDVKLELGVPKAEVLPVPRAGGAIQALLDMVLPPQ